MLPKAKSFKVKLIKVVLAACISALILISISINIIEINLTKDKLIKDLTVIGQIIGNRSIAALVFFDNEAGELNLSSAKFNTSVEAACLYDSDGELFSSYVKQHNMQWCHASSSIENLIQIIENNNNIELKTAIIDENQEQLGHLVLFSNLEYVNQTQFYLLSVLSGSLFIALILASILASKMLRKTLKPLDDLHQTALSVVTDRFLATRAEKQYDDEVGQLVDSFNLMLDNLSEENDALVASESRFRTLSDHAPIGIYLKDTNLSTIYVNKCWLDITQQEEMCNGDTYLAAIDEQQQELYLDVLTKVKLSKSAQMVEYHYSRGKDGKPLMLMEYIAPLQHKQSGELTGYIGSVVDATELKNAQLELEKLAFYDPLTNLPNRRFFREHLHFMMQSVRKENTSLAVFMLDLDHFKKVNDSMGHDAGDELLIKLAERIRTQVFDEDVVSRMGGDEFMLLIKKEGNSATVEAIANRILISLQEPIVINQQPLSVSASIGVAFYPEDATTAEDLVKNADIALYKAKDSGRNQVMFFSAELDAELKERVRIENKLKLALVNNDFQIYIQPQYDLRCKRFIWGEALIRWIDEEDGFIPPDKFIPIAEETNLIVGIGEWVLNEVCSVMSNHADELNAVGIEGFAINLSARQFFSNKLISQIETAFTKYKINPEKIEFELTESLVMEDINKAIKVMKDIRSIGCKLSIDDCGTGYSSLSYLRQCPINAVKIDRSFITGIPSDKSDIEISAAIIAMAHKLGLETVAEGVETQAHFDFLVQQKCEYLQGYLLARPMPIHDIFQLNKDPLQQASAVN